MQPKRFASAKTSSDTIRNTRRIYLCPHPTYAIGPVYPHKTVASDKLAPILNNLFNISKTEYQFIAFNEKVLFCCVFFGVARKVRKVPAFAIGTNALKKIHTNNELASRFLIIRSSAEGIFAFRVFRRFLRLCFTGILTDQGF